MKRIKINIYLILCLAICFSFSLKLYAWRSIEIERINEDPVSIDITDDLQISFTSTHLVADNRQYCVEIPISDLKGFQAGHIANDLTTDVESLEIANDIQFNATGIALSTPQDVIIYTLSGLLIRSEKECSEIDFLSLPKGVYLVTVNKISFKIKI